LVTSLMNVTHSNSASETQLTRRQREVLQSIAEGKTMKETATLMGISTRTAESHKYEVMRLLGVKTTAALIRYPLRTKLIWEFALSHILPLHHFRVGTCIPSPAEINHSPSNPRRATGAMCADDHESWIKSLMLAITSPHGDEV